MNEAANSTSPWAGCPLVFIPAPPVVHCPVCGNVGHIIIRTMPTESDGSFSRRCICRACASRFVLVLGTDNDSLPAAGRVVESLL